MPPAVPQLLPELIPVQTLFGNPVRLNAQLSPDGKWYAFLADNGHGVMNVFVKAVPNADVEEEEEEENAATQITFERHRSLRQFFWTKTPGVNRLFYLRDTAGDENDHLRCVDFELVPHHPHHHHESSRHLLSPGCLVVRDLTPFDNTKVMEVHLHRDFPHKALVTMNYRTPALFDVYSIDLVSGQVQLEAQNPGEAVAFFVTKRFELAGCWTVSGDDASEALWVRRFNPAVEGGDNSGATTSSSSSSSSDEWTQVARWPQGETSQPLMFNHDATGFYVETTLLHDGTEASTDKSRLVLLSTKDGRALQVLASDDKCDVSVKVGADTIRHTIDYAVFEYTRPRVEITNEAHRADLEKLVSLCNGAFALVSRSADDRIWVYTDTCDNESTKFYVYWRDSTRHALLFDCQPALSKYTLSPMTSHVIKTSDGEDMVVYMTLPPGVPERNLPFVVSVHGGPWARDCWGYHKYHQLFANRGYGCLSVNFRGSTGFGKRWVNLGNKQWGGTMQQDVTEAAQWAINNGYADQNRVAIYGASYGGYSTLCGLAFTPELFCCGVDVVGPSNLKTMFQSIASYFEPYKQLFHHRVGDVLHDDELNRKISPLFHADKICKPLLIIQGANDPRVKQTEADQIAKELLARKHDVQYVVYNDEGHGCVRQPNVMDMNFRIEEFLADHLGGRKGAKDLTLIEGHAAVEIDPMTLL